MRVNRAVLLKSLELLVPGLAVRETVAQSSCIVFDGVRAMTFNEEIFCSVPSPLEGIVGAVKAKPLLDILSKMGDDDDIEVAAVNGSLGLKRGKDRKCTIKMEAEVVLPVDSVQIPTSWLPLHESFAEGIEMVHVCASSDTQKFSLTCVHVTPDFVEACDRFQVCRFPVATPVSREILMRAQSIKHLSGCGMTEIAESETWTHFRNKDGLVISMRRFLDPYPNLTQFLTVPGSEKITLPASVEEAVARAEVFSGENAIGNYVGVTIADGWITFSGKGVSGNYDERKQIAYGGRQITFQIAPKLLVAISKRSQECQISEKQLIVDAGKFIYVTSTKVATPSTPAAPAAQ